MTLSDARSKAAKAIEAQLKPKNRTMRIYENDGAFFTAAIKKFNSVTPAVIVTALSSELAGIRLAVYLLTKESDKNALALADDLITVIRGLPGDGLPLLDVTARTLYDAKAAETNTGLWALAALWPHHAVGPAPAAVNAPVVDELTALAGKAVKLSAKPKVGSDEASISRLIAEGVLPQVHIRSSAGEFTRREGGTSSYEDKKKVRWKRKVIGRIRVPITLRMIGRSESEAESMAAALIPNLARREERAGLQRSTEVKDYSGAVYEKSRSVSEITLEFTSQIGETPVKVPVIKIPSVIPET